MCAVSLFGRVFCGRRRSQFEKGLLVQSWRLSFDEIEMVNSKGKSKDASVSYTAAYIALTA